MLNNILSLQPLTLGRIENFRIPKIYNLNSDHTAKSGGGGEGGGEGLLCHGMRLSQRCEPSDRVPPLFYQLQGFFKGEGLHYTDQMRSVIQSTSQREIHRY